MNKPLEKNKLAHVASTFTLMKIECQGIHFYIIVCLLLIFPFPLFSLWESACAWLSLGDLGLWEYMHYLKHFNGPSLHQGDVVHCHRSTCHEPGTEMQCFRAQHHLNSQTCSTANGMGNHGHAFSGHLDNKWISKKIIVQKQFLWTEIHI